MTEKDQMFRLRNILYTFTFHLFFNILGIVSIPTQVNILIQLSRKNPNNKSVRTNCRCKQEIENFKLEARNLLDSAEKSLLALYYDPQFDVHLEAVLKSFQRLNRECGLMDLAALHAHTEVLQSKLMGLRENSSLPHYSLDFFLMGIRVGKKILSELEIQFDFKVLTESTYFEDEKKAA